MFQNIKNTSIAITLLIVIVITYISIEFFGEYGWTLFVIVPFLIGFLPPYLVGRTQQQTKKESYKISFLTLLLACLCLLVFAYEGIICILMASPIAMVLTFVGSHLAYILRNGKLDNPNNTMMILILITVGCMGFDTLNEPTPLIPAKTKIVVNAPIEEVWKNVVTFSQIEEPTEWIFKTGVAYPMDAIIEGTGVGAVRYCNFTTGSFVEPITTWDEPYLLQFDVKDQPIPMTEYNPFWEIHPPHLDGYFKSYKGQFQLSAINENQTQLEGTTWYKVDITPEVYWQMWSDFILHKIHERVLKHIKKEAEGEK